MTHPRPPRRRLLATIGIYAAAILVAVPVGAGAVLLVQRDDVERDATISTLRAEVSAIEGVASVGVASHDRSADGPWQGVASVSVGLEHGTSLTDAAPIVSEVLGVLRGDRWANEHSAEPTLRVHLPASPQLPNRAELAWFRGLPADEVVEESLAAIDALLDGSEPLLRLEYSGNATGLETDGFAMGSFLRVVPVAWPGDRPDASEPWQARAAELGIDELFHVSVANH